MHALFTELMRHGTCVHFSLLAQISGEKLNEKSRALGKIRKITSPLEFEISKPDFGVEFSQLNEIIHLV